MLRRLLVGAAIVAVIGVPVFWILTIPISPSAVLAPPTHTPNLENGRTMFLIGGCSSCHAVPKQDDTTRLGGGLALPTAFGTFYVPNISSDAKDGIGGWSEAQFLAAMRYGISPAGQHLYPAFPYTSYQLMRSEDLRDLFAYLKTLPAVSGAVRDHALKFPFSIRRTVGLWKLLFLDGAQFKSDPSQSAQWNRGAYLVNAPGHCAECHSPRNFLGAMIASRRFTGGQSPTGQGGVPDITQGKLHDWKVEDFVEVLDSGMTPDADRVGGAMVDVVANTRQLNAGDRQAIAVYLKSLRPK
ncbi:MAG TPA: cytochrome c [Pseudolabrys sp.]|jgi:mono/diheme cytochrome c family protein